VNGRTFALIPSLAFACMMSGCAAFDDLVFDVSPPKRIGDDTYLIATESGPLNVAERKVMLIERAQAHCASLSRRMERIVSNQTRGGGLSGQGFLLDVEYRCVAR
jgi:hypothetical protein